MNYIQYESPRMIQNPSTHNFGSIDGHIPGTLSAYFISNVPHLFNSPPPPKKEGVRLPTVYKKKIIIKVSERSPKKGESTIAQNPTKLQDSRHFSPLEISPFSLPCSFPPGQRGSGCKLRVRKARSRGAGSRCINRLRSVSHSPLTIVCPCGAPRQ